MADFEYARLRRWPDVEADNLFAFDATDRLLAARAVEVGPSGDEVVVIGDDYGAITLALVAARLRGIRVHQDLMTGRRALAENARTLGLDGFRSREFDAELLRDARLVLLQLPKSLAELEEIAAGIAQWASPEVVVLAGGRVKHMTLAQNEVLGRYFRDVRAERAEQKSRIIVCSAALPGVDASSFPVLQRHADHDLVLAAHGAVFAGAKLDIGTRVLLECLPDMPFSERVLDLGCGTGALATAYARKYPEAVVIATDRSASAVVSARATARANGVNARVTVTHDDAASELADGSIDLVLLNPPFHLGTSVHAGAATRLFDAAARVLRPGGELWTVFNSSLAYRPELVRRVGETEQRRRTPKFTVTRSVRR